MNSVGIHSFNLFEGGTTSEGSFTVVNDDNENNAYIILEVVIELKQSDLDKGEPKIHSKVDTEIRFQQLPENWIKLEETSFTIPPSGSKTVNYTVEIPKKYLSELNKDVNKSGYLCYISIKGEQENVTGSGGSVGVNYQQKTFIKLYGRYESKVMLIGLVSSVAMTVIIFSLLKYHKIRKRRVVLSQNQKREVTGK